VARYSKSFNLDDLLEMPATNHHEAELIVAPRGLFRKPNCAWLAKATPLALTPLVAHSLRSRRLLFHSAVAV
jgi:hypothetical protein